MKLLICKLGVVMGFAVLFLGATCMIYGTVSFFSGCWAILSGFLLVRSSQQETIRLEREARRSHKKSRPSLQVVEGGHSPFTAA